MNLLNLVRDTCALIGLPLPSAVIGNSDPGVLQLLQLANKEGRELSSRYGWQSLVREGTWTSLAAEDQGAVSTLINAGDSYRYIINNTIWNRSESEAVPGSVSPAVWQAMQASPVSGPYGLYRIRGDHLYLHPAPSAGLTLAFEYVSKNWLTDSAGTTYRSEFASDTDVPLLGEDLMRAGLEWRWLQRKGFEYGESFASYERLVADAMARDGTKPIIDAMLCDDDARPAVRAAEGSWPL